MDLRELKNDINDIRNTADGILWEIEEIEEDLDNSDKIEKIEEVLSELCYSSMNELLPNTEYRQLEKWILQIKKILCE